MSTRVHELAKELGLKSPDLLDRIQKWGLDVKVSALASLDPSMVDRIKQLMQAPGSTPPPQPQTQAPQTQARTAAGSAGPEARSSPKLQPSGDDPHSLDRPHGASARSRPLRPARLVRSRARASRDACPGLHIGIGIGCDPPREPAEPAGSSDRAPVLRDDRKARGPRDVRATRGPPGASRRAECPPEERRWRRPPLGSYAPPERHVDRPEAGRWADVPARSEAEPHDAPALEAQRLHVVGRDSPAGPANLGPRDAVATPR